MLSRPAPAAARPLALLALVLAVLAGAVAQAPPAAAYPGAPWFEPGATRSARRVFLHVVAETAQHAGHADILREAIDGQKTMG